MGALRLDYRPAPDCSEAYRACLSVNNSQSPCFPNVFGLMLSSDATGTAEITRTFAPGSRRLTRAAAPAPKS
jgi:hypothetical protein